MQPTRATPQPLPPEITSVQPGGGVCYRIEMAWGGWRRRYLKRFRPGYVARMAALRRGDASGAPHEILDPRDLKYCRNLVACDWDEADDRFRWRGRLPFARWGLTELLLMGGPLLALTVALAVLGYALSPWLYAAAAVAAVPACLVVWFFRNPPRRIPQGDDLMVSPADGKVVEITHLDHDEHVGGPAVRIGIFLSIFNVHLNRAPCACRVIAMRYQPGEFLNAQNPESSIRNENLWIGLEDETPPHRRLVVRAISGMIARRIVCGLRPGEVLRAGQVFGMIKLGSRTELVLPEADGLSVEVEMGDRVKAGTSVLARYDVRG